MSYINLIVLIMVVICPLAYISIKRSYVDMPKMNQSMKAEYRTAIILTVIAALIIRIICGLKYNLHTDLGCFNYWSEHVYLKEYRNVCTGGIFAYIGAFFKDVHYGFIKFYDTASFADYPPGYMYILWIVAAIKDIFNIETSTAMGTLMIKSPAIVFDLFTAFIIYKIAKKNLNQHAAFVCFMLYIFNPAVILNSAVWGQVDSVFCLGIFLMCYCVYKKETKYAYFCYAMALLIKPQALLFTPVIMAGFAEEVIFSKDGMSDGDGRFNFKFNLDALKEQGIWLLSTIIGLLLIIAPFGVKTVINKYKTTMKSYEYASVNAYNIWSMFGLDWITQEHKALGLTYQQWGTIAIVCICFIAILIWIIKTKDRTRYFMIAIFICIAMFTFAVRMHERYIYPAVILLLFLFIVNKQIKVFWLYVAYSIAHFYNAAHVLFFYDASNFDRRDFAIIMISLLHVSLFMIFMGYCKKAYLTENEEFGLIDKILESKEKLVKAKINKNNKKKNNSKKNNSKKNSEQKSFLVADTIEKTKKFVKFTKVDWIIMGVITIVYAIIAFRDLGDMDAPQKFWETKDYYTNIDIELPEGSTLGEIDFYLGNYEERDFSVYVSDTEMDNWINLQPTKETVTDDDGNQTEQVVNKAPDMKMDAVFCWNKWEFNYNAKYIRLVSNSDCCVIGELVIKDTDNNVITPVNADDKSLDGLFDEQDKLPEKFTFRNSTYFDEIYHARTAYEYIKGLYSYENTHPPLGKIFIALGMMIFGVCPFGWRFAGTLFGVLMVPCIYIFAKQLFEKTNIATIGCLLFTFDFMHFAQSRIATIDVFVTFFVILMYYFMYKYYKMSFYDTKLWKTFIPLGLSAVCMGLGCACKWTGVYAGLGLGVIFFYLMFKRYREYRYAKENIKGSTDGIEHSDIVKTFKKKLCLTLVYCVGTFVIIAGTIYTLSYIPFVSGYITPNTEDYAIGRLVDDLVTSEDAVFERESLVGRMLANQYTMYSYHSEVEFEHSYSSKWYEWPLIIRPIWYYSGELEGNIREGISAMGNPLVWWCGIPAFMYMIYLMFKKRDKIAIFLSIGYLAEMIPWVPIARLTFIYHYFPSVPFVALMLTYSIYRILQDKPQFDFVKITINDNKLALADVKVDTKYLAYAFTGLAIVLFIMFYPVLAGQAVDGNYVNNWLRWLDTWVFISF